MANSVNPNQMANIVDSSLIWVYTVCPDLFVRNLRGIISERKYVLSQNLKELRRLRACIHSNILIFFPKGRDNSLSNVHALLKYFGQGSSLVKWNKL